MHAATYAARLMLLLLRQCAADYYGPRCAAYTPALLLPRAAHTTAAKIYCMMLPRHMSFRYGAFRAIAALIRHYFASCYSLRFFFFFFFFFFFSSFSHAAAFVAIA